MDSSIASTDEITIPSTGASATADLGFRPIDRSDGPALVRFHEALSPESQRSRFFAVHPHLSSIEVERFTHVDHVDREAIVATHGSEILAVGRYERLPGCVSAEVAFVTADDHRGEGIASQLLTRLADAARTHGINEFVAQTLADNHQMLGVFARSGLLMSKRLSGGVTDVSISLTPVESTDYAGERSSEVASPWASCWSSA